MKKTIITAALALSAALAYGTEYTTTTTGTGTGAGNYYGWCTALTHSYLTTTTEISATDVLTLNSITLNGANSNSSGSLDSASKLAIFTHTADYTIGSFVGLSDSSVVRTANTTFTYTFTGVNLTAGQQYQFLFVNGTTTAETFTNLAEDTTLLSAYQAVSGTVRHELQNHDSIPSGDGTYKNNAISSWEGPYVSNATYSLSTPSQNVPEPATATLSLLALAGLAARRRRK